MCPARGRAIWNAVGGRLNHATLREALLTESDGGCRCCSRGTQPLAGRSRVGGGCSGLVVSAATSSSSACRGPTQRCGPRLLRRADFTVLVSQATLSARRRDRTTRADIDDVVGHIELVLRGPAPGDCRPTRSPGRWAWRCSAPTAAIVADRTNGGSLRPTRRSPLERSRSRYADVSTRSCGERARAGGSVSTAAPVVDPSSSSAFASGW